MMDFIKIHCLSKIAYLNREEEAFPSSSRTRIISQDEEKRYEKSLSPDISSKRHVGIVLNTALSVIFITNLCESDLVILADGAINVLADLYKSINKGDQDYLLNELSKLAKEGRFIHIGDMDSSRSENIEFFRLIPGFLSFKNECQISTDFEKALTYMKSVETSLDTSFSENHNLIVYGGIGGSRFDHTMATLHTITKLMREETAMSIVNYNVDSVLIGINRPIQVHLVDVPQYKAATNCDILYSGYFSLDGVETTVTTKGFQYDVTDENFTFGKTWISSSNSVIDEEVSFLRYDGAPGFLYLQQLPTATSTSVISTS